MIKQLPSKLTAFQNRAQEDLQEYKKYTTQEGEIHNVWHPIKDYQLCKKQEKRIYNKENNQSMKTQE